MIKVLHIPTVVFVIRMGALVRFPTFLLYLMMILFILKHLIRKLYILWKNLK